MGLTALSSNRARKFNPVASLVVDCIIVAMVETTNILRNNITSYDTWYVALAEALDCSLATLDQKLMRANGSNCTFVTPR